MKRHFRLSLVIIASFLVTSQAAANSVSAVRYIVDPGSTITPEGSIPEAIDGDLLLRFVGFCVLPVSPTNCSQTYEVPELSLVSASGGLERPASLPTMPGPFIFLSELGIPMLGPAILATIVLDREVAAAGAGAVDYTDLTLRSKTPNDAGPASFGASNYPMMFDLDLELVEIVRRSLSSDGPLDFPTTISTQPIARLSLSVTAVPEPGPGILLAVGLCLLALARRGGAPRLLGRASRTPREAGRSMRGGVAAAVCSSLAGADGSSWWWVASGERRVPAKKRYGSGSTPFYTMSERGLWSGRHLARSEPASAFGAELGLGAFFVPRGGFVGESLSPAAIDALVDEDFRSCVPERTAQRDALRGIFLHPLKGAVLEDRSPRRFLDRDL